LDGVARIYIGLLECDTEGLEVVRVGDWGMLRRGLGRLGCGNMRVFEFVLVWNFESVGETESNGHVSGGMVCVTRVYSVLYHGSLIS